MKLLASLPATMPSTRRATTASAAHTFTLLSLFTAAALAHAAPSPDSMGHSRLHKRAVSKVGCYSSATPLESKGTWQYQSTGYCSDTQCGDTAVFALTNGDSCFCGDEIPADSDKVDDSKCDMDCTGYPDDNCGGDGFWQVYTTSSNVPTYGGGDGSSTSSASSSKPSGTNSQEPTVVTSSIASGGTVLVTVTPTADPSAVDPSPSSSSGGGGSNNTAGIAAGVVVGVVAITAIAAGLFFFIRHKKRKQAEEDFKQRNQVADFMRGSNERKPPNSSYSGMSDQRLDPEAGRRNSVGSLADNQDYSRRILRVANPDSS